MKKNICSLIIVFTFFLINYSSAQEKIAFIDLNYLYINSKIGKKMNKEMQVKQKNINKELAEFQKKIDTEKKDLLAQKNVLAESEFRKKLIDLENNLKKYNQILSKKNEDLRNFQKKSRDKFATTLKSTLENYSKENSISMIFRKENLLIGKNTLDITKEILDLFNKS